MKERRPEVVIHCAGLNDTQFCEQHPTDSYKVNVQGTVRVAKACKITGAKLLFMSSDQVYNGTNISGPHKEDVNLQPVTIYGKHKIKAEQRMQYNLPETVGLRLSWMFVLPDSFMKLNNNILVNLQNAYIKQSTINATIHEFRGVTYVWDIVKNIKNAFSLLEASTTLDVATH